MTTQTAVDSITAPADINEAHIRGTVLDEPNVILTQNGSYKCLFRVRTTRIFNVSGERREQYVNHYIVAWDTVVHLVRDLHIDERVEVFGYLKTFAWTDVATGVKLHRTEIVAENVIINRPKQ